MSEPSPSGPLRRWLSKRVLLLAGVVILALLVGVGGFLVYSVVRVQGRLAVHEKERAVQTLIVELLDAQAKSFERSGRYSNVSELREQQLVKGDMDERFGADEYSLELRINNDEGTFQIRAHPRDTLDRALYYYADQTFEIRCNQSRPARKSDPQVGEAVIDF